MKQKFRLCAFSRHILMAGLLYPFTVCAVYIAGVLGANSPVDFRFDALRLAALAGESFAACAVVAIACAFLAEWLYRRGNS